MKQTEIRPTQVPRRMIGTDAFQETPIVEVTRAITKHNYLVMDVADLPRCARVYRTVPWLRGARAALVSSRWGGGGRHGTERRTQPHRCTSCTMHGSFADTASG